MVSASFAQTTNTNCTATSSSGDTTDVSCTSNTIGDATYGPTPAQAAIQVEQQKEMNENMAKIGDSVGVIIAKKRAQHAQEKSDLTAVVYCRQNPTGSWAFANKAPMPCPVFERNVVAYCTVNAKTPLCKDVAKLPPASAQMMANPDEQRIAINVVFCQQNPNGIVTTGNGEKRGCADEIAYVTAACTVQGWKGKQCEVLANNKGDAVASTAAPQIHPQSPSQQVPVVTQPTQNLTVSQPQAQSKPQPPPQPQPQVQPQAQMVNVSATQAPQEISLAEAARRNKAAKEAANARENPQAQAQPQQ